MDSTKVLSLLEQFDDEMDDLEESLAPLIKTALSESAAKLPLLQKAKMFTLVTYAIESMLFSYLRLNGVKAREHPVFLELTRVKQYFDKIKAAETPEAPRNLVLDKSAAARFIKAGLAGNDKYDLEKAEREAKERAKAHIKFTEISNDAASEETAKKPQERSEIPDSESESSSESDSPVEVVKEPTPPIAPPKKLKEKKKKKKSSEKKSLSGNSSSSEKVLKSETSSKEDDKAAKKAKREKKKAKLLKKQKKAQS